MNSRLRVPGVEQGVVDKKAAEIIRVADETEPVEIFMRSEVERRSVLGRQRKFIGTFRSPPQGAVVMGFEKNVGSHFGPGEKL